MQTYKEDNQKQLKSNLQSAARSKYTGPLNSKGEPKGYTMRGGKAYPRNKPCPCGSGIKFKNCYLRMDSCGIRMHEERQKNTTPEAQI